MKRTLLTAILIFATIAATPVQLWAEYDAVHGRFLQRDPAEYADSHNLYEGMKSNPLKNTDPSGFMAEDTLAAEGLGYNLYLPEYIAGLGARGLAQFVAGMATARNLALSLVLCAYEVAQTNPEVLPKVGETASNALKAARDEIARFTSNSADKPEAYREGFRQKFNGNSTGDPGSDPDKDWSRYVKALQTGGNKVSDYAAKTLAKKFNCDPKDVGKAVDALKKACGESPSSHGKILENGAYVREDGTFVDWIESYLP